MRSAPRRLRWEGLRGARGSGDGRPLTARRGQEGRGRSRTLLGPRLWAGRPGRRMSWFNASQLSSFAKQALSQAQKSIDRVLDIQEEEPGAWAPTIPYGEPGMAGRGPLCPFPSSPRPAGLGPAPRARPQAAGGRRSPGRVARSAFPPGNRGSPRPPGVGRARALT